MRPGSWRKRSLLPCDGRPLAQAIIVVLGMAVATVAGRRCGDMDVWLIESRFSDDICRRRRHSATSPISTCIEGFGPACLRAWDCQ